MVTKKEMDEVVKWCEKRKKEKGKIYIIERNPFVEKIEWMRRFPLIEIDRPITVASKSSLVYDSTTKQLWQYIGGDWRKIEPDVGIRIE